MQVKAGKIFFQTHSAEPEFNFRKLEQVHGTKIVEPASEAPQADGFYLKDLNELKTPLCILTADCMPVLIQGKNGLVFLHAGWKGLARGILVSEAVKNISPVEAFIGPCIMPCCYQVDSDFPNKFQRFGVHQKADGKTYFDLLNTAKNQLISAYPGISFESSNICTCCDSSYHSYRRDKTEQRNYNIISLSTEV